MTIKLNVRHNNNIVPHKDIHMPLTKVCGIWISSPIMATDHETASHYNVSTELLYKHTAILLFIRLQWYANLSFQPTSPDGRLPGQVHYENLCMKAVNQSIGRSIRHARDYATIVLVDQRYARSSVRDKLPDWIASQLQVCQGFGQAFAAIRKVYHCGM